MSTQISREIEDNTALIQELRKANPLLIPDALASFIPSYKNFGALRKSYGLWSSPEKFRRVTDNYFQHKKVILLISGVAAGGKDTIREEIERQIPGLSRKIVTGTSRNQRQGETHKKDYYFYESREQFMAAVAQEQFIEWVLQGERLYGMPKESLRDALNSEEPFICSHIEMSAWPRLESYIRDESDQTPFVLKFFVLPYMTFQDYEKWLGTKRDDVPARLARAGWEIATAADSADFIVTNRIRDDKRPLEATAQAIVKHAKLLLEPGGSVPSFAPTL